MEPSKTGGCPTSPPAGRGGGDCGANRGPPPRRDFGPQRIPPPPPSPPLRSPPPSEGPGGRGTHRAMAGETVAEAVAAASSFLDIAPICDSRRRRAATSAARELDMTAPSGSGLPTAGAGRVFSQVHEYEVSTRQTPGRNLGLTRFPRQTPASAAWIGTRSFEWPGIEVPPVPGGQGFEGGARIPGGEPSDVGGRTRRIGCVARLSRVSRPAPAPLRP